MGEDLSGRAGERRRPEVRWGRARLSILWKHRCSVHHHTSSARRTAHATLLHTSRLGYANAVAHAGVLSIRHSCPQSTTSCSGKDTYLDSFSPACSDNVRRMMCIILARRPE